MLDSGTTLNAPSRIYGKAAEKSMGGVVGGVYEVSQVVGDTTIYPGDAKYKGLWPNQEQRTGWQLEDRTAKTVVDLEKQQKKDSAEDNFAALKPLRDKYKRLISQNQRAALMAQIIAFITR